LRAIVHSKKHYVQVSLATVTGGASVVTNLVVAVDIVTTSNVEVLTGSTIKAVFVEMWIRSTEASPGTVLVSLVKCQDGQSIVFADHINLNDYNNKKNVFYHTQGLTNDNSADAIPFIRQWFKIPKGKQRFGLGDTLRLIVSSQAAIDNVQCGFATYKEYS